MFVAYRLRNKEDNKEQNNGVFDPCGMNVGGERRSSPEISVYSGFANRQVGRLFRDLLNYRGVDSKYNSGMLITKRDFTKRYPAYHFNLEKCRNPSTTAPPLSNWERV